MSLFLFLVIEISLSSEPPKFVGKVSFFVGGGGRRYPWSFGGERKINFAKGF